MAFAGWRGWTDDAFVHRQFDVLWGDHTLFGTREVPLQVRVGGDRGLQAVVRAYAAGTDGALLTVYYTDRDREGESAGAHCNRRMLLGEEVSDPSPGKPADLLLAFPQPDRPGPSVASLTWNAIGQAHYRGIEVRIPAYLAVQS